MKNVLRLLYSYNNYIYIMSTIKAFNTKFQKIDIPSELPKIIEHVAPDMIALNQQQLYRSSIDSLGNPLGLYKSPQYALKKYEQNPGPGLGKKDLNLTGSLYRGMFVQVDMKSYLMGSVDSKAVSIEARQGKYIWGLTKANKTKISIEEIKPLLLGYIRNVAGI